MVVSTADLVLVLNLTKNPKNPLSLNDLFRRAQQRTRSSRGSLVVVYVEPPLLSPSARAWLLPGDARAVNEWPDSEAALRDIKDGIGFVLGEPQRDGPVSVFYSYSTSR